jgi:UDP-2,3-diacylglucosamine hydrolase
MSDIGLVAGNGEFPFEVARAAKKRGLSVFAVCIRGEADPKLESEVSGSCWIKLGQLGKLIKSLRDNGIKKVLFAGGVRRSQVFRGLSFDFEALSLLTRLARRSDDAVLRAIADRLRSDGIEVVGPELVLESNVATEGALTPRTLTEAELTDAKVGWTIARQLGALDVGQGAIVFEGVALAVEALEGTDAMITRAGTLCGRGGVLVKVAKPGQDLRMDLPAIGPATVEIMQRAGLTALVLEVNRAIILDRERTLAKASRYGIAVVALNFC